MRPPSPVPGVHSGLLDQEREVHMPLHVRDIRLRQRQHLGKEMSLCKDCTKTKITSFFSVVTSLVILVVVVIKAAVLLRWY
jgi:hypothetical protein